MAEAEGDKLLGLLGLARRADKLALGASAVERMVHRGMRPLVIIASDVGDQQRRRYLKWSPVRGFVIDRIDRQRLAAAMNRRELAVVGVAESGFVNGIRKLGVVTEPAASE